MLFVYYIIIHDNTLCAKFRVQLTETHTKLQRKKFFWKKSPIQLINYCTIKINFITIIIIRPSVFAVFCASAFILQSRNMSPNRVCFLPFINSKTNRKQNETKTKFNRTVFLLCAELTYQTE